VGVGGNWLSSRQAQSLLNAPAIASVRGFHLEMQFEESLSYLDLDEWEMMHDFSRSVGSDFIREDLLWAIHSAGAFRNFRNAARRLGVEAAWFSFRADALRQIALGWCEENQIAWE
jgi:hypothetical protein